MTHPTMEITKSQKVPHCFSCRFTRLLSAISNQFEICKQFITQLYHTLETQFRRFYFHFRATAPSNEIPRNPDTSCKPLFESLKARDPAIFTGITVSENPTDLELFRAFSASELETFKKFWQLPEGQTFLISVYQKQILRLLEDPSPADLDLIDQVLVFPYVEELFMHILEAKESFGYFAATLLTKKLHLSQDVINSLCVQAGFFLLEALSCYDAERNPLKEEHNLLTNLVSSFDSFQLIDEYRNMQIERIIDRKTLNNYKATINKQLQNAYATSPQYIIFCEALFNDNRELSIQQVLRILRLIKSRINPSNNGTTLQALKTPFETKLEKMQKALYEELKDNALAFILHTHSQFNRSTQAKNGDWWSPVIDDLSPVRAACSCNAAIALIDFFSSNSSEDFNFDTLLDRAQFLYYKILDKENDTSGRYLFVEEDVLARSSELGISKVETTPLQDVLVEGEEIIQYQSLLKKLQALMLPDKTKIGTFIQIGVNIFAITLETNDQGVICTIIDSHGLSQTIPADPEEYDKAFRISFKTIDEAAQFLALHHPSSGTDNPIVNTVLLTPVEPSNPQKIDPVFFQTANAYAERLAEKRAQQPEVFKYFFVNDDDDDDDDDDDHVIF